ncbi:MAG TPA: NADH-quinone oxidoreductase subunit I [Verrucomicrobiae bacterium]
MKKAFLEVYYGFKSLLIGMRITIGQFFKPIVTVQYPHATLKIAPRFRGHIELVRDPQSGVAKCFVCKLCEKACPSDCITVEGVKPEGGKRKTVTYYRLDFTKCSLCGSCVEACRDQAIRFSREYNLAGWKKEDFIMDLFKRLEDQSRAAGTELIMPAGAGLPSATPTVAAKPAATSGAVSPAPQPAKAEPAKAAAAPMEVK